MAKYGNFVAQKDLVLTEEEKQMFLNFFKEKVFGYKETFKMLFTNVNIKEDFYSEYFRNYYFEFMFDKPLNGRNVKKDRINDLKGIYFTIHKEKGYLERKNENGELIKDYENAQLIYIDIFNLVTNLVILN